MEPELVELMRFDFAMEAHVYKARLEAEGISSVIRDESPVWVNPLFTSRQRQPRLLVPATELARAREILASLDAGEEE
jgi:hypothetical protein